MSKALSSLAVGTKIEVPVLSAYQSRFGAKIVFKIADKNHSGYPANSVTLIAEKIIQLMCSDAKEPSNSNSDRKNYGNNRHIHSNILQWLNSNATAGKWYSAKHGQDAPPTNANVWDNYNEYDAWAGFLAMLDPKFVAELLNTTLTVVKSSTDGGSYETFTAKMFLASTTEVGLANENGIAEGSRLALFSNDASRVAYPTAECVKNSEYTSGSLNTSSGWYWWLRTPTSSNAFNVRSEDQSLLAQGALSNPAMNKAFLAGMVMQLSVLLLPPLQGVFSVCPMDLTQWVTVLALAMAPIPICEAEKALRRRRPEAEEPRQEKELSAARK